VITKEVILMGMKKKFRMTFMVVGISLLFSTFYVLEVHAKTAKQIDAEVNAAIKLFSQQVKGGKEFLNAAKGVLVIPNIIKAGLGVGGEYGEGALRIGGKTVEYYSLAAGSVGFQIGAQKTNLILIFMQEEALKNFRSSAGWKVGVDGSVTFIDVGKGKSLDTLNIKDPIVAFMFGQKGLMANATIEGAKFTKLVR
jgi:lipid-binding SYLF domain-containing protein